MESEPTSLSEKFMTNSQRKPSKGIISIRQLFFLLLFLLLITNSTSVLTGCGSDSGVAGTSDGTNSFIDDQSDDDDSLFYYDDSLFDGNGSYDDTSDELVDCGPDYLLGPAGGVLTVDDPTNPSYGVTVEVAPGELDVCRTFSLSYDYLNVALTPYLPYGFLPGTRRNEGVFEIETSWDPPYEAEITITFPLSGTDLNVGAGEVICAFYFDKTADSWRFVMPQSIDEDARTMTVVTTYREVWNWGRVDVQAMDRECLEAALKDQMGQSVLSEIITDIEGLATDIENENISLSSCTTLRSLQSGLLEDFKQTAESWLTAAKSEINPTCGSCDPLSSQFQDELVTFIEEKAEIWIMGMLADHTNSDMLAYFLKLDVLISYLQILDLSCDYGCVWDELGAGFWLDYCEYKMAIVLQEMIDWYIAMTPSLTC